MLGKQSAGIFVILVLRLVCHNLWQPMNNHSCGFPKQIKWMIEEHAYIKAKWKTFSRKAPGPFFFKKRHTEGFSWSSSAHISWFPSVAFWFHHPGKKSNTSWFAPAITGWPRSVSSSTWGEVLHTRRTLVQKQMTFCVISLQRTGLLHGLIPVLQPLVILSVYVRLFTDGQNQNPKSSTQLNVYAKGVLMPEIQWMQSAIYDSSLILNYCNLIWRTLNNTWIKSFKRLFIMKKLIELKTYSVSTNLSHFCLLYAECYLWFLAGCFFLRPCQQLILLNGQMLGCFINPLQ